MIGKRWILLSLIASGLLAVPGGVVLAAEACSFVQLCDTQLGMGGYDADKLRFEAAVDAVNALGVDWVVVCGDLVNDGNDDQAVADFKSIVKGFRMPVYLASGNHDVGNEPTVASLTRYREMQGPDFYAVTDHGFRLLVLNTQLWKSPLVGETEKQDAWFSAELESASAKKTPILLVSHYPPFTQTPDEEDNYYNLPLPKRGTLLSQAKAAGVKAWLAGHVHKNLVLDYEGMPVVASATTSRNFDKAPYGFRVWTADEDGNLTHRYESLDLPAELTTPTEVVKN